MEAEFSDEEEFIQEITPKTTEGWYKVPYNKYHEEEFQEAVAAFEKALIIDSRNISAWFKKGSSLNKMGKHKEAIEAYEEALKIDPNCKFSWNGKGNSLDDMGKFVEAIAAFDEALKIDSKYKLALNGKGVSLRKMGKYAEAIATYEEALKIDSKYKLAWNGKGNALRYMGNYEKAISAFEEALKIDPDYKIARNNKKQAENSLANQKPEIEKRKILGTFTPEKDYNLCPPFHKVDFLNSPKTTEEWYKVAYNKFDEGEYQEAVAAFDKVLIIDSGNISAWFKKGSSLNKIGKHEEAIEAYEEALKIDPNCKFSWNGKGNSLDDMGKFVEAIAAFDEALKIDSKYKLALNGKGVSLRKMGKYAEAIVVYEEALIIDSKYKVAWNGKGNALRYMGSFEKAISAFEEALKIDPDYKIARKNKKEAEDSLANQKSVHEKGKISNTFVQETDYNLCPPFCKADFLDTSFIELIYEAGELKFIGKGGFGKVLLAKRKDANEIIAVKVIETNSLKVYQEALNELSHLEEIGPHPYIMTHLNYETLTKNKEKIFQILIELPLATSSLENILKKYQHLPEEEIIRLLKQISSGLHFAHERKLAHMDLKPDNILIIVDEFKITDWGASLRLRNTQSSKCKSEIAGTWGYTAPELEDGNYGTEARYNYYLSDIYSLGMILLRVCGLSVEELRKIPKGIQKYHDLCMDEMIFPKIIDKGYSEKLTKIIRSMISFVPKERISLKEVLDGLK